MGVDDWPVHPGLPQLLTRNRAAIAALCRAHGVEALDVFGSAAGPRFDPQRSDVDLIARFDAAGEQSLGRRFVAFGEAMEQLLGRPVQVLTDSVIANPYLRRSVEASRVPLYVRTPAQAPV